DGDLEHGSPHLSNSFAKPGISGRVEVAGDQLLVPLEGGAALIDPARPAEEKRAELAYSGNLVVAGSGRRAPVPCLDSSRPPSPAVDSARLHTYLAWDQAESLLTARVAAHPKDAQPLLTYLELAARTGRAERLTDLSDRTLDLLNSDPTSTPSLQGRQRLFA